MSVGLFELIYRVFFLFPHPLLQGVQFVRKLVLLLATLTSSAAFAQSDIPSTKQITQEIIAAVTRYRDAISCSDGDKITPKDVAALVPLKSIDDRLDAKYAVFWGGDIGCLGGSGTYTKNMAIVKVGAGNTFYVAVEESAPQVTVDFPSRGYERLVGNFKDTLVVDTAEYGPDDPNCCPSIRTRYTLRVDDKGNWKVLEKRPAPVKKM